MNGTIGEMHARKIVNIYDLALKVGAPVVGLYDCAGLRLEEATDALEGFGQIMAKQAEAAGIVPQIAVVLGSCGGGLSVSASMCDFVFASKEGKLFVNTPNVVKGNNVDKCDTASAAFKAENGAIDVVNETEEEVLNSVRQLVSLIPANLDEAAPEADTTDDLNRETPELAGLVDDGAKALAVLSDDNFFFELKKDFAKEMVTGFIKLDGVTIGAIANRAAVLDDNGKAVETLGNALTVEGVRKAVNFVEFCDAFDIPVLTLTNVSGFGSCICQERRLALPLAKLASTFANADIAKINLITGKAIGSAYIFMNSKALGADMVFALDSAKIGPMEAELEAQITGTDAKAVADAQDATMAAKRGYVDSIIDAAAARKNLVYAFEMLY
jgi:acetyl-CoA carboxylase carboxyltransferase component